WRSLRRATTNMDTLIAMGATVAYAYSAVALLGFHLGWWHDLPALYFMEATGLLALISVGHWLEARARDAAGSAIRELLDLLPAVAMKLNEGEDGGSRMEDGAGSSSPSSILHSPSSILHSPSSLLPPPSS